ncbi:hypothetical protein GCM10023347_33680 [Streptomyces chumphonensis]|uniref:DUF3987 domain-containing protein n=1 Tax=Streptomyces chumphonensis TaxID=1214925 RepID=A0A927EZL9_9ACTN|nr:DUF3987 domain-containing protein [Streptomyces chumphonensis]MBD3931962.1 DUF3987 domain-containing protein [Streptomyces chumphonensis]
MTHTPEPLAADLDTVRSWLDALYGGIPGYLSICSPADGWKGSRFTTDEAGIAAAVDHVARLDKKKPKGIYAQVTTLREQPTQGRGGEELAYGLRGLWSDLDFGTVGHKPAPGALPLPPDEQAVLRVVSESGLPDPTGLIWSGYGAYAWWWLDEPHLIGDDRDRVKQLSEDWQTILAAAAHRNGWSHDTGVSDLARILRIPGTVNRKADQEKLATIGEASGALYSLDELQVAAARSITVAKQQLQPAPAPPRPGPQRAFPQQRATGPGPFDVIEETASWHDILAPVGWSFVRNHRDGREEWKRPAGAAGASESDYSALCSYNPPVMVNFSDAAGLPTGRQPSGRKLTMGRVFAELHYGGDVSAAARDVMRAATGAPSSTGARYLPAQVLAAVKQRCTTERPTPEPVDRIDGTPPEVHSVNSVDADPMYESGWEEPLPIDSPPLPSFPTEALGPNLAPLVSAAAETFQVPEDLPGITVLGIIASAIGGRRRVQVTPAWHETTSLWVAGIANSSELKSPLLRLLSAPIKEAEKELRTAAAPVIEEKQQERRIAEGRMAAAEKQATSARKADERDEGKADAQAAREMLAEIGEIPSLPRILFGDLTPEVAQKRAAEQGGRIAVASAEGGTFEMMTGVYSQGQPNINFFLNAYSGDAEPVDRISRETITMDSAHVSLSLLVQPSVLDGLARKHNKLRGKGLLGRFIYAYPMSRVGERAMRPAPIPPSTATGYSSRIHELVERVWDSTEQVITFTDDAADTLIAFRATIEPRLQEKTGDLRVIGEWAGKLHGTCARIASVLALYDNPGAQHVSAEHVGRAVRIARYLIAHASRIYEVMDRKEEDTALDRARDIISWLRSLAEKPLTAFTRRDAQRGLGRSAGSAEDVQEALDLLDEYGWVARQPLPEREPGKRGQNPLPRYLIHPWVYSPPQAVPSAA